MKCITLCITVNMLIYWALHVGFLPFFQIYMHKSCIIELNYEFPIKAGSGKCLLPLYRFVRWNKLPAGPLPAPSGSVCVCSSWDPLLVLVSVSHLESRVAAAAAGRRLQAEGGAADPLTWDYRSLTPDDTSCSHISHSWFPEDLTSHTHTHTPSWRRTCTQTMTQTII